MTNATIRRILDLSQRITGMVAEVSAHPETGWPSFGYVYYFSFPGCLPDCTPCEDCDVEALPSTEREAWEAAAEWAMKELRSYSREDLASALS